MILSGTLLLITTFLFVYSPALLVWNLLAVVEVERAALLPGYDLTIVPSSFFVRCFFLPVTFLTLLSFHISVLFYVNLPAFLVWNLFTGCLGLLVTLQLLSGPAFLLRNLYTTFHIFAVFLGNILAALTVGCLAEFFGCALTLLIIGGVTLLLGYVLALVVVCCVALLFGNIRTLLVICGMAFLLVLALLFGHVFTGLTIIIGRFALLFICSFTDLLVFTVLLWDFFTLFVINSLAVLLGHLFTLLVVHCLAVLLWNLVALLVINCLTVFIRDLLALLLVGGGALLVILALVFVFCFAFLLWDRHTFVFIYRVAHVRIGYLTFSFYPGLTGTDIVKLTATTAGKRLQSTCNDIQCASNSFG